MMMGWYDIASINYVLKKRNTIEITSDCCTTVWKVISIKDFHLGKENIQ